MQKIVTNLWFDSEAESAAKFYVSVFKNSKIKTVNHYGDAVAKMAGRSVGQVMVVSFELDGQEYIALNGGPMFKFNHAISLMVKCADQKEIDYFWEKLSEGGEEEPCGWLRDKYGLSWQIVPKQMDEMMSDKDSRRADQVMKAMANMKKLDLEKLTAAFNSKGSDQEASL
ncbi:VOC family protein [Bdellovibrio sp. NC01]|uniref:VOC family protein n=1 Tax=Bdellovibrio sp. NC01 TaxID=2220073 RepID=UPI001157263D|nr:VOC family protein [Bdellovibrio sp. NC01]QDK37306.1 VOC family protein [Bdellovibrio sp. NC01]